MKNLRTFQLAAAIGLLFMASSLARGQISVPAETPDHVPIVATLSAPLPEGAQVRGTWAVTDGDFLPVDHNTVHIWAPPGKHIVTARGVYVVTRLVNLPGESEPVPILLDFGQYEYTAEFSVAGGPPVPPPPPPGQRWAVIVDETSLATPQNRNLYQQLRRAFPTSRLLILDPDQLLPAFPLIARAVNAGPEKPSFPVLVIVGAAGDVLRTVEVPRSVDALKQELAR